MPKLRDLLPARASAYNSPMSPQATPPLTRRRFLTSSAVAALAFPFISRLGAASANGLLNHASFGASGMAGADLTSITATKLVNLVAVAEIDEARTAELRKDRKSVV